MPKRFWATWPMTMFVLSPSVATTTASASSIPACAQEVGVHAVADEECARPVVAETREGVLVLVDDGHVPASSRSWSAMVEPTLPQPMISAFMTVRSVARTS